MRRKNGLSYFYQWELNQRLIVEENCTMVLFYNGTISKPLGCEVFVQDGVRYVYVPNILLQTAAQLEATAWDDATTSVVSETFFSVIPKAKPENYAYTETEVKMYEKLLQMLKEKGAYYTPVVDQEGNLRWEKSLEQMPDLPAANIRGPQGEKGEKGEKGDLNEASVLYTIQDLPPKQQAQARTNIGAVGDDYVKNNFANALKGSVSGEGVIRIDDASPLPHEMAVSIDVQDGTVKKLGKNLFNLDALLSTNLKKDDSGIYHLSGNTGAFSFDTPIPANLPVTITFVDLQGHNANSDALIRLSKAYADGSQGVGTWLGVSGSYKNKVTITNENAFLRFAIIAYNPSADYWCTFSGVQVEIGETATDYEPYKDPDTYTSDENGAVRGIVGNGEAVTLFADNGATITAEYNRDTNKVIAKLEATLSALLGG